MIGTRILTFMCINSAVVSFHYLSPVVSQTSLLMAKGFGNVVKFKYTGDLKPGTIGPTLEVPNEIARPDYALDGIPKNTRRGNLWEITPQTPEDVERMKVAGRIAREVLDEAVKIVKPGLTTMEIDALVHAETIKRNSYPSPLNYHGFPKSCCTSINEVICHGIPDDTKLKNGDIVNIDVTIFHDGVHGDCSETVFVGTVSDKIRDLVVTTYDAWKASINICKPGVKYSEIGKKLLPHISCAFTPGLLGFCRWSD